MGRKTKTERVLENENFELGKTRVGNLALIGFWTLSEGQGSRKWRFQKKGETMGKFVKEGQEGKNMK